jgi:hypothetical protein
LQTNKSNSNLSKSNQIKSQKPGFIWISGYLDKRHGVGLVQLLSSICPVEPASLRREQGFAASQSLLFICRGNYGNIY